jgi:tellurite resistance protein TerC
MHTGLEFWIAFNAGVLLLLALDLFVFHRKSRQPGVLESAAWSLFWICLSLAFNALVWRWKGAEKGLEFLTGYLIEYSLSVDNIFVFVLIFAKFKIRSDHQHRVLFFGILGALLMRGVMIAAGVKLVEKFSWTLYLFGVFLLVTGVRMFFKKEQEEEMESGVIRFCRRHLRVVQDYQGKQFFVRIRGAWALTPLALALVVVELMDLIFAVDSIPAIFAVTTDPFIVYTSNICAILGLRSLYFLLARLANRFVYLQYGLAAVLSFIGLKMLIAFRVHIPTALSLGVVAVFLAASVAASLLFPAGENRRRQ